MREIKWLLFIVLVVVSTGCILYASIMQCIVCYQMYGVIFTSETVFIPHESAWFFLGILGYYPAMKLWEEN